MSGPHTTADLERMRMALAEAGHKPSDVSMFNGHIVANFFLSGYVAWKAAAVTGLARQCWPCRRVQGWVPADGPPPLPCDHPIDPFCPEDAEMAS